MSELFQKISPEELNENPFHLIGKDWFLITAKDPETNLSNTMTASWGGVGILWNKPVAICYIRPQRHTLGFVEKNDRLSLSVLPEEYRSALRFCGSHSGREYDKWKESGLTPVADENGTPFVEEARLVFLCKKLWVGELRESGFLDTSLLQNYPIQDYHKVFICEIEQILKKILKKNKEI